MASRKQKDRLVPDSQESSPPAALARHQKFQVERVLRSQLLNAPYNPRVISDKARGKLRKILAKNGLVEPLVWNRRSGHLVGGHQRIACLDSLEGTKNYSLDVAVVDLDDKTEKELNVALNNGEVQGDWELEALEKLFKEDKIGMEESGFDLADVYQMFGESPLIEQPDAIAKLAQQYRDIRQRHEKATEGLEDRDNPDFYAVVLFRSAADRLKFLQALDLPDNRYVDGYYLAAKLGAHGEGPDPATTLLATSTPLPATSESPTT